MYFIHDVIFVAQPDGQREIDGIVGTGVHRTEYVLLKTKNEYGGEYNFVRELEPTTNPHRGYEHRFLTEEEKKYLPLKAYVFARPADEGEVIPENWYYLPPNMIELLCPVVNGVAEKPIGTISLHDLTIWNAGAFSPEKQMKGGKRVEYRCHDGTGHLEEVA